MASAAHPSSSSSRTDSGRPSGTTAVAAGTTIFISKLRKVSPPSCSLSIDPSRRPRAWYTLCHSMIIRIPLGGFPDLAGHRTVVLAVFLSFTGCSSPQCDEAAARAEGCGLKLGSDLPCEGRLACEADCQVDASCEELEAYYIPVGTGASVDTSVFAECMEGCRGLAYPAGE